MGCDIHAHIEVKLNGKWRHFSCPNIHRRYCLFTRICGVRQVPGIVPISLPRGLPNDISEVTKTIRAYDGPDGHSDTWLDSTELGDLVSWVEKKAGNGYMAQRDEWGYLSGGVFCLSQAKHVGFEDIRLVCWFDN